MGRKSTCLLHAELIEQKATKGLSAQRIYQDLKVEAAFCGSYQSVKRFVRKLRKTLPQQVWRLEVEAGEEAQVDFGTGAPLLDSEGRKQKTWLLAAQFLFCKFT